MLSLLGEIVIKCVLANEYILISCPPPSCFFLTELQEAKITLLQ